MWWLYMDFGTGIFRGCGEDDSAHIVNHCCISCTFVSAKSVQDLTTYGAVEDASASLQRHPCYIIFTSCICPLNSPVPYAIGCMCYTLPLTFLVLTIIKKHHNYSFPTAPPASSLTSYTTHSMCLYIFWMSHHRAMWGPHVIQFLSLQVSIFPQVTSACMYNEY